MKKIFFAISVLIIVLVTSVIHFFSLYAERYVVNAHDKQLYEEMLKSGEISTENKELIFLLNAKYDTVNEKNAFKENAENYDAAMLLINYLLEPEIALANAEYIYYASPNTSVTDNPEYSLKGNEILYPKEQDMPKVQYFSDMDIKTRQYFDKLWQDVKLY